MKKELIILSTRILDREASAFASGNQIRIVAADFIKVHFLKVSSNRLDSEINDGPLIFTSKNGVAGFKMLFNEPPNRLKNREVYCLSGKTKEAVESIEWLNITATASNAGSLGDIIINLQKPGSYNYFCGKSRRDELPDMLKKAGIRFNEFHVYETVLKPQRITSSYVAVLFFSPSAVDSFFQSNILTNGTPCFCVGETTAAAVQSHGAKAIAADRADQQAVLEKAIEYFRSRQEKKL